MPVRGQSSAKGSTAERQTRVAPSLALKRVQGAPEPGNANGPPLPRGLDGLRMCNELHHAARTYHESLCRLSTRRLAGTVPSVMFGGCRSWRARVRTILAMAFCVVLAGCAKGCGADTEGQWGCNVAACGANQTRVCQGQCAKVLANGSPCSPNVDCAAPEVCGPGARCIRPGAYEYKCTPVATFGNGCDPSVPNECALGLFCLAQQDFQVTWQDSVPPGFCVPDHGLGASCQGAVTHRSLECGAGLVCANDGTCHRTCQTDANCPCNSGQACKDSGAISPPGNQGNVCYTCADTSIKSPPCSSASPCCQPGNECEGVAHLNGTYCCHRRSGSCDGEQQCCGTDVCRAGACVACAIVGSACTADGDCCFGNSSKCCGNACAATATDPNNCGGCGKACPIVANAKAPICVNGTCPVQCLPGFANCDGKSANGCETNLTVDPSHCGACGHPCPANSRCQQGVCVAQPPPVDAGQNCATTMQACVPDHIAGPHCCQDPTPELCIFELCRSCTPHGQVCPLSGSQVCCNPNDQCIFDPASNQVICGIPDCKGPDCPG